MGTTSWMRGTAQQVDLAHCCALNSQSPNAHWGAGWLSASTYATSSTITVAPGQIAQFVYQVVVPRDATPGDYCFGGELVIASTGAPLRLVGYAQVVRVR